MGVLRQWPKPAAIQLSKASTAPFVSGTWPANVAPGDIATAAQYNAVVTALSNWGGDVGANQNSLLNATSIGGLTASKVLRLSGIVRSERFTDNQNYIELNCESLPAKVSHSLGNLEIDWKGGVNSYRLNINASNQIELAASSDGTTWNPALQAGGSGNVTVPKNLTITGVTTCSGTATFNAAATVNAKLTIAAGASDAIVLSGASGSMTMGPAYAGQANPYFYSSTGQIRLLGSTALYQQGAGAANTFEGTLTVNGLSTLGAVNTTGIACSGRISTIGSAAGQDVVMYNTGSTQYLWIRPPGSPAGTNPNFTSTTGQIDYAATIRVMGNYTLSWLSNDNSKAASLNWGTQYANITVPDWLFIQGSLNATGQIACAGTLTANNTVQTKGTVTNYSLDSGRYLQFQLVNGADPQIVSSTQVLNIGNTHVHVLNQYALMIYNAGNTQYGTLQMDGNSNFNIGVTGGLQIIFNGAQVWGGQVNANSQNLLNCNSITVQGGGLSVAGWGIKTTGIDATNVFGWLWNGNVNCYVNNSNVGKIQMQASETSVKENIRPFTRSLETVRQLNPYSWQYLGFWRGNGQTHYGLLADDAEHALPEMVEHVQTRIEPDDEHEQDVRFLNPYTLLYVLLNAVKELDRRLATVAGV